MFKGKLVTKHIYLEKPKPNYYMNKIHAFISVCEY